MDLEKVQAKFNSGSRRWCEKMRMEEEEEEKSGGLMSFLCQKPWRRPEEKKFLNPETSSDKRRIVSGEGEEQNKWREEAGRERGNFRGGVGRCHQTGGAVENKRGSTFCCLLSVRGSYPPSALLV